MDNTLRDILSELMNLSLELERLRQSNLELQALLKEKVNAITPQGEEASAPPA